MTAMTIGSTTATVQAASARTAASTSAAPRKGIFARVWAAFIASRIAQAEREIALHRHLLPLQLQEAGDRVSGRSEKDLPFVH